MPNANQRTLTKVTYKPSTQSTDEFTIIVNFDEVRPSRALCPAQGR